MGKQGMLNAINHMLVNSGKTVDARYITEPKIENATEEQRLHLIDQFKEFLDMKEIETNGRYDQLMLNGNLYVPSMKDVPIEVGLHHPELPARAKLKYIRIESDEINFDEQTARIGFLTYPKRMESLARIHEFKVEYAVPNHDFQSIAKYSTVLGMEVTDLENLLKEGDFNKIQLIRSALKQINE